MDGDIGLGYHPTQDTVIVNDRDAADPMFFQYLAAVLDAGVTATHGLDIYHGLLQGAIALSGGATGNIAIGNNTDWL
jgi:hypothetical protein